MDINWKTLPALSSLRAFELTARSGTFAAAARALNVTHAAIAQRVRSLEADLGVSLVRRSGRSVVLTEAGAQLAGHLTTGFGTIASGIEEVKTAQNERPLQITTTVFFSQVVLLPRLEDFWRRFPGEHVSVMPSQDVIDIATQGIDLAIRGSPVVPEWSGLTFEPLVQSELIVVGAPSMVTDDMPPLDDLPWIWSSGAPQEEQALAAFGLDFRTLENNDVGVPSYQFSLARQGLGLVATPEILVCDDLASGALVRVALPSPAAITYYAVTPSGPVRPKTVTFIAWLKETLAKQHQTSG